MKERLQFFPITAYAVVMGLSGLTIVFSKYYHLHWMPKPVYDAMLFFTFGVVWGVFGQGCGALRSGVSNEGGLDAVFFEERGFEGEEAGELIYPASHDACALWTPRPCLWGAEVDDRDVEAAQQWCEDEVEVW